MARTGERASHTSFFSYNIQRPYPLRWFTPVAIIGGLVITILVSFANFVASGYELTTVYASDPDSIGKELWFKSWPSWLRQNIEASCEPANLPVNSQFFTNQTALSYTLTSVHTIEHGVNTTSPSLPYLDNVLKECKVLNITMDFDCSPYQTPTQRALALCAIDTRAFSTCTIEGPNGLTVLNFTSLYNPKQSHFSPGSSSFIATNVTTKASLWWAQQLLTASWLDTDVILYDLLGNNFSSYNEGKEIPSGAANFYRHEAQGDITQLDFFDLWFDFTAELTKTFYYGTNSVQAFVEEPSVAGTDGPPMWKQADTLAKAMYSAVMTDLGQINASSSSNIVANPDHMQFFSRNFSSLHNADMVVGVPYLMPDVPDGTYEELRDSLGSGPLEVTPSVISTKYLCSVPRLKTAGNIFISILLADLVLLHAAWVLYCLVVERFFVRGPMANTCEGCLQAAQELQPFGSDHESGANLRPSMSGAASFSTETDAIVSAGSRQLVTSRRSILTTTVTKKNVETDWKLLGPVRTNTPAQIEPKAFFN
ncbi:uncharacterized protein LTR77_004229 [Saxophila tyrrhenica]|uniref:Uncharacterized protein n=1 Tax=Saxophila tyrrhenica TaxID=1690608 RepID=A0AAV9PFB4_9PEZI|nr:hypothetical protein LTR77_004229 [Saxophila tyrrhenica]